MHSRSTTIIGAGVAVAILGAVMVFAYARNLRGSASASSGATTAAIVASAAIPSGTKGEAVATSAKRASVPSVARPADAVTSVSQLSGLVSLRSISAGEVITTSQFGAVGTPNQNTGVLAIPAGHNAITVTSPVPQAVAGYVSPGDLVNIFMTLKDGQGARLLVSNVAVLATVPAATAAAANAAAKAGTSGSPAAAAGSTAPSTSDVFFTLSLTPAEAEKVIFAQTYESLWYGLVHPGDGSATSGGQTLATLFK